MPTAHFLGTMRLESGLALYFRRRADFHKRLMLLQVTCARYLAFSLEIWLHLTFRIAFVLVAVQSIVHRFALDRSR